MAGYRTYTSAADMGAYISKLVLDLPEEARSEFIGKDTFNVFVERRDPATGEVVLAKEHHDDKLALPSRGYVPILDAYTSDAEGTAQPSGTHVALELPEIRLTKRMDGGVLGSRIRTSCFRITQTQAIASSTPGAAPLAGLVFDTDEGDICPDLAGWDLTGSGIFAGLDMNYGFFTPDLAAINARRANPGPFGQKQEPLSKVPLVLWLHGAGEGNEPYRTVMGNKVTSLSSPDIQGKLGGAAYILAPSSPTYWMDSGDGNIADDNQSIYTKALKALVDEFIAAHPDIDTDRVYVGGLSNGGFMTCRLVVDYPGFFAAGVPVCAPWVESLASEEEFKAMAKTPLWFVQAADDPLVDAETHALADYRHLKRIGAKDVHVTCYDHIEDETGRYKDKYGQPQRYVGHFIWINAYHDTVKTELDGTNVLMDGRPVTLWEWVGRHSLA